MRNFYYCINPKCQNRQNPDAAKYCQACGTALLIGDRYRIIQPLRSLQFAHPTEIFEVEDWGTNEKEWRTRKVLKILKSTNNFHLFNLFKQEARVLMWLRYPEIPKVEPDGYFRISPHSSSQQLLCLVMDKIPGENLGKWLEKNQPISQAIALAWLPQITAILDVIHSQNIVHRDIKPSNLILKPNGKLALIDFGSVKVKNCEIAPVGSWGYAPPEQLAGKTVQQSDFFALGRTLVHLLTGRTPTDFPVDESTNQLIWRDPTLKIESLFGDLIDEMMNEKPEKRPKTTRFIFKRLKKLS
ncbi:MAG TPA: serine/threonine-protein kinase [Kamptonema sp.]|nr:serine/threonine-protein kinase [Kamptonema sp.]